MRKNKKLKRQFNREELSIIEKKQISQNDWVWICLKRIVD